MCTLKKGEKCARKKKGKNVHVKKGEKCTRKKRGKMYT